MSNNKLIYELLIHNVNIDDNTLEKIKTLSIDKLYNEERVVFDKENNIYIKFIDKYDNGNKINNELFIAGEILDNRLKHKHLINLHGIIKLYDNKNIINTTTFFDLFNYKQHISPTLRNCKTTRKNIDLNICGILMPKYDTFESYLEQNKDIDPMILLINLLGILDLMIYIRDTYNFIHSDIKIQNILVKDDIFYVIDWEDIRYMNDHYYSTDRPRTGNTEMYPHYNATPEQFFIYSIGVLIVRILGYNCGVTHKDFIKNIHINYILSYIPIQKIELYENIIENIFNKKYNKIENIRKDIDILYNKIKNG
jgi:hypothetical protein